MRKSVIHTHKGNHSYTSTYVTLADYKARLEKLRNDLRTELTATSFVVSDFAQWDGNSGGYTGMAFVVKNGVHEWLFLFSHQESTNNYIGRVFGGYDSATVANYFQADDGTGAINSDSIDIAVHYNCGNESYDMGFDDGVALTYTLGDYQPPASDPSTIIGAGNFMPATECLWGIYSHDLVWNTGDDDFARTLYVFDEDSPSLTVYNSRNSWPFPYMIHLLGQATVNADVTDTDTSFTGHIEFSMTGSGNTGLSSSGNQYAYAFNLGGTREEFNYVYTQDYTAANFDNVSGEFKWKSVTLSNVGYEKGILDTNLVRVTGAYNSIIHYGKIIDGPNGPFFRASADLAFPYSLNTERFPWPE